MRGALVVLAVAAAALAGCAGPAPESTSASQDPCVVESADDFACAEKDQNKTANQVAHVHDYWNGLSAVELLEETQDFGAPIISSCDAYPMRVFLPPDGATVYQGTGRVDITAELDLDPDSVSGPMEIWVRTAGDDAPRHVAGLEDGETVTIEINATDADLPHQVLSAWEFWVYVHPDPRFDDAWCIVQPRGTVGFEVEIHKTLPIEPFPGHPDHWGESEELPLLDAFAGFTLTEEVLGTCSTGGGSSHPDGSCQMHWRGFGPLDGSIVPPGSETVELTLTADAHDGDPDAQLGLRYHGADTREFEHIEPVSRDNGVAEYEIPVDGRNDGPYAEQSQWRFQVVTESDHRAYRGEWSLAGPVVRADA